MIIDHEPDEDRYDEECARERAEEREREHEEAIDEARRRTAYGT